MNKTLFHAVAAALAVGVTSASADQVILDDLIVDGSQCVGQDCVNGENFGFDTIRLKENNLRIKFEDTSSSGSFPSNDWQITANDSSNGGANKFSIDDVDNGRTPFTIEANAPSNSLYVDDGGRVGFGTSTPAVDLHAVSGNTPTLRLEQNGSSGFTAQTWDVAGNEANFFVRDVTNGSALPFRIEPSSPSNSVYIDSTGNVGLGTTSPDSNLDVEDSNGPGFRLTNTGTGGGFWDVFVNANTSRFNVEFSDGNIPFKIDDGANDNLLQVGVGAADRVTINGTVFVGTSQVHPDYVFEPDFALESIEEHAAFMWERKHLPALPPASGDDATAPVELISHQFGILEELEKAHIYIEQLNTTIKSLTAESARKDGDIEVLEQRLARLEARLSLD